MKKLLKTEKDKLLYFLGYLDAQSEQLAKDCNWTKEDARAILVNELLRESNKLDNFLKGEKR